jgi:oleate hydratase
MTPSINNTTSTATQSSTSDLTTAPNAKAHLIGAGIASLASAVYFIRYKCTAPENITIYESLPVGGGSLDAHEHQDEATNRKGYFMRGGRMFDKGE